MNHLVSPEQLSTFGMSIEAQIVENFGHVAGKKGYQNFEGWEIVLGNLRGRTQIKMSKKKLDIFISVYSSGTELLNVVCVKDDVILSAKSQELKLYLNATDVMDEVVCRLNTIASGFNLMIECYGIY